MVGPTLDGVNLVLPVVLGLLGVVLAAVGILGLQGKLRRNRFVGVRTAASLRDDEAFLLANRVAGVPNVVAGVVALGSGALVISGPVLIGVIGLVGVFAIAVAGGVMGHRAAEALPVKEAPKGCGGCACGGGGCSPLAGL